MASKNIKVKFIKNAAEIDVRPTKDLLINILATTYKLGIADKWLYTEFNAKKTTIYAAVNSHSEVVSTKPAKFIKAVGEHISENYCTQFSFDTTKNTFNKISVTHKKEFKDGIYYAYFQNQHSKKIEFSVLYIQDYTIEMWSNDKRAKGKLIFDMNTYSAVLYEVGNEDNIEFYIGIQTLYPEIKYFNASWRNSQSVICSVVCMAKHIKKPPFKSWVQFRLKSNEWRKHMEENKPTFATKFFMETEHKFIHYNITEEYAKES